MDIIHDVLTFIAYWEHSRMFLLFLFMISFIGIILYLVINPDRSKRLESYRDIPFIDDEQLVPNNKNHEHIKEQ